MMKSVHFQKKHPSITKPHFTGLTVFILIVLVLYAFILFGLLFWALITAFKSQDDFYMNSWGFPATWYWNFTYVFKQFKTQIVTPQGSRWVGFGEMFWNSFLYCLGCSFTSTIVPCITAYLCAKFDYKFSRLITSVVIVAMIVPIVGSLPSEIRVAQTLGLYNHIWGLWIMRANFLGIYYLVFYSAFKQEPKAYGEAASIDGAGNFAIMFRISLPLVRNLFFTVMLVNFISFWNDYQTPLVYLPSYPTVAYGMYLLSNTIINGMSTVPMRMAAAVLMSTPILLLFGIFHKRLLGNLSVGGIKG